MKKFYLLILLFSISFSQDIKFFGTILDTETKEPIIDANIVFIGSDFGSASDLNGNFSVTNLQKQEYEILISAIGYKDIIVLVNLITLLILKARMDTSHISLKMQKIQT